MHQGYAPLPELLSSLLNLGRSGRVSGLRADPFCVTALKRFRGELHYLSITGSDPENRVLARMLNLSSPRPFGVKGKLISSRFTR